MSVHSLTKIPISLFCCQGKWLRADVPSFEAGGLWVGLNIGPTGERLQINRIKDE
jgi:hypothetical protein